VVEQPASGAIDRVGFEDAFLNVNGICLHVIQAGPADGPLVVLLHGFPEFWYGWRRQIRPLAKAGFRLLVPDQRGYNLSDKPKEVKAYRLEELSSDVIGLLDHLGRQTCYLVGHDWGAAVAWNVALTYPQRIEKLVIMNVPHPAVMLRFLRKNPQQMLKSWYIAFFQIPGLADWLLRSNDCAGAARLLASSGEPGTFSDADFVEYKKAWSQPAALTSMIHWYRALLRCPPRQEGDQRLSMPVLMLWGKQDVALSYEMAQPSIDLCDLGKLVFFDKASHWVQHDEVEKVNEKLLEFLQSDS
jgi:pimeloyl-ACP methyl ester carboxylesterase